MALVAVLKTLVKLSAWQTGTTMRRVMLVRNVPTEGMPGGRSSKEMGGSLPGRP
jgi:hypothetical protein